MHYSALHYHRHDRLHQHRLWRGQIFGPDPVLFVQNDDRARYEYCRGEDTDQLAPLLVLRCGAQQETRFEILRCISGDTGRHADNCTDGQGRRPAGHVGPAKKIEQETRADERRDRHA